MANRNAKGHWLPGASANPGGRPRGRQEFTELARRYAPEALARLMHWVRSNKEGASCNAARAVIERAWGRPPSTEEAAAMILPSAAGKPSTTIRVMFVDPPHSGDDE